MQRRIKVYVKRTKTGFGERLVEISFIHYAIAKLFRHKNVFTILTD